MATAEMLRVFTEVLRVKEHWKILLR